jgi:uncharacterized protein (TIGR03435 family)
MAPLWTPGHTRFAAFLIGLCLAAPAASQQSPGVRPSFEVASIKRSTDSSNGSMVAPQPGGRFVATYVTLRALIQWAYDIQNFQLEGGPAWMSSDFFDIQARAPEASTSTAVQLDRVRQMLQSLLADRFKLRLRTEPRERAVYLLTGRTDRRPGPQLEPTQVDCSTTSAGAPPPTRRTPTGAVSFACGVRTGIGTLSGGNMTMTDLASWLSTITGQSVLNRTDLSGRWNVDLVWAPAPRTGVDAANPPAADPDRPSLFTAVQEQLGLRLESTRAPVDVLVIEHVEPPSPD